MRAPARRARPRLRRRDEGTPKKGWAAASCAEAAEQREGSRGGSLAGSSARGKAAAARCASLGRGPHPAEVRGLPWAPPPLAPRARRATRPPQALQGGKRRGREAQRRGVARTRALGRARAAARRRPAPRCLRARALSRGRREGAVAAGRPLCVKHRYRRVAAGGVRVGARRRRRPPRRQPRAAEGRQPRDANSLAAGCPRPCATPKHREAAAAGRRRAGSHPPSPHSDIVDQRAAASAAAAPRCARRLQAAGSQGGAATRAHRLQMGALHQTAATHVHERRQRASREVAAATLPPPPRGGRCQPIRGLPRALQSGAGPCDAGGPMSLWAAGAPLRPARAPLRTPLRTAPAEGQSLAPSRGPRRPQGRPPPPLGEAAKATRARRPPLPQARRWVTQRRPESAPAACR